MKIIKSESISNGKRKSIYLTCICDCGNEFIARKDHINSKKIVSCGCWKRKQASVLNTKHGVVKLCKRTYNTWLGMINRCNNKNHASYNNYGGRGIGVCEDWINIENFVKDMGLRPIGMELERIDNSKGYSKENCIWATRMENMQNTRRNKYLLKSNGTKVCVSEIVSEYKENNISESTIRRLCKIYENETYEYVKDKIYEKLQQRLG